MEDGIEWEVFPAGLITALKRLPKGGLHKPEALIVVGYDDEGRETTRSFARKSAVANPDPFTPDPPERLGRFTVFGAQLVTNSPLRCYWNGHKWVCY
jgi:hypothetical protein